MHARLNHKVGGNCMSCLFVILKSCLSWRLDQLFLVAMIGSYGTYNLSTYLQDLRTAIGKNMSRIEYSNINTKGKSKEEDQTYAMPLNCHHTLMNSCGRKGLAKPKEPASEVSAGKLQPFILSRSHTLHIYRLTASTYRL